MTEIRAARSATGLLLLSSLQLRSSNPSSMSAPWPNRQHHLPLNPSEAAYLDERGPRAQRSSYDAGDRGGYSRRPDAKVDTYIPTYTHSPRRGRESPGPGQIMMSQPRRSPSPPYHPRQSVTDQRDVGYRPASRPGSRPSSPPQRQPTGSITAALAKFTRAMHNVLLAASEEKLAIAHAKRLQSFPSSSNSPILAAAHRRVEDAEDISHRRLVSLQDGFADLMRLVESGNKGIDVAGVELDSIKSRLVRLEELRAFREASTDMETREKEERELKRALEDVAGLHVKFERLEREVATARPPVDTRELSTLRDRLDKLEAAQTSGNGKRADAMGVDTEAKSTPGEAVTDGTQENDVEEKRKRVRETLRDLQRRMDRAEEKNEDLENLLWEYAEEHPTTTWDRLEAKRAAMRGQPVRKRKRDEDESEVETVETVEVHAADKGASSGSADPQVVFDKFVNTLASHQHGVHSEIDQLRKQLATQNKELELFRKWAKRTIELKEAGYFQDGHIPLPGMVTPPPSHEMKDLREELESLKKEIRGQSNPTADPSVDSLRAEVSGLKEEMAQITARNQQETEQITRVCITALKDHYNATIRMELSNWLKAVKQSGQQPSDSPAATHTQAPQMAVSASAPPAHSTHQFNASHAPQTSGQMQSSNISSVLSAPRPASAPDPNGALSFELLQHSNPQIAAAFNKFTHPTGTQPAEQSVWSAVQDTIPNPISQQSSQIQQAPQPQWAPPAPQTTQLQTTQSPPAARRTSQQNVTGGGYNTWDGGLRALATSSASTGVSLPVNHASSASSSATPAQQQQGHYQQFPQQHYQHQQ